MAALPRATSPQRTLRVTTLALVLLGLIVPASLAVTRTTKRKTTTRPKTTTATATSKAKATTKRKATTTTKATTRPVVRLSTPTTIATPAAAGGESCRATRIMPLGDSLTLFPEGYRGPLYRTLKGEGRSVDFVGSMYWEPTGGGDPDSEGHGGFVIGPDSARDVNGMPVNLADNVTEWVAKARPDVILLQIGTNDMAQGGDLLAKAPSNLAALVAKLQGLAHRAVIVIGDVPLNAYDRTGQGPSQAINAMAKRLGEASDSDNVLYAPTSKRLPELGFVASTHTVDGVHVTAAGGELLARAWLPTVHAALQRAAISC